MYRTAAAFIIMLFSVTLFSADSTMERWNVRIERMNRIQGESLKGRLDKTIIDELTSGEIKSCKEFIGLLERYKKEDGSLKAETKKYSLTEIENKVKEISTPAISLSFMS